MGAKKFFYMLKVIIIAVMIILVALKQPVPASAAPDQGFGYWTDSFTDATGIFASTNISVSGGDVKLTLGSRTSTYNYVGVTVAGGPHDAYYCAVKDWATAPTGTNLVSKTEAASTNYQQINSSNNVRWSTNKPGSGGEVFLWSNMSISESRPAVQTFLCSMRDFPTMGPALAECGYTITAQAPGKS